MLERPITMLVAHGVFVKEVRMAFLDAGVTAAETPLATLIASTFWRVLVKVRSLGD